MRLAERDRQRALRAERLARLRPMGLAAPERPLPGPPAPEAPVRIEAETGAEAGVETGAGIGAEIERVPQLDEIDSAQALEEFLRALTGARAGEAPAPLPVAEPGALLAFQRPERAEPPAAPGDLDRLAGAGPGLIWALERAGLRRLADLAPLDPEDLVARLGPIGRLVPAEAWLATARGAAET